MKFQPLPIYGGSYADDTLSWSAQDCLGWIPSNAEVPGTKTEGMFKTPPGLRPFAEVPPTGGGEDPVIPSPPVRGAWNAEGKMFVVIGTTMYQLSNAGVFIPLGTIPGTGRVIFSHNQVSLGNQILAVNGSAGYIYDTRDQVFQRITDPGYPGAFVATFIDGYFAQISANRRFAFNSDVANGLEYNKLDRFTSEFSPDLLVSLVASNNELFLLSETSGEFFENTGAAQQPFRSKRITMDRGCAGAYTVAKADNTVFWLGNNGYFYVLNGYAPQRISTRAIEQSILGKNWKQAFAFTWEDAGHTVIYWTFPDGLTWGYDTSTGLWHRRESYELNRWRVNTMTFWNQEWYAGDFQYGRIWKMDWDYTLEGDQEFPSERTTAVIHDNQNRIIIPRLELLMQVGQEETIPGTFPEQPDPPTLTGDAPDGTASVSWPGYAYTASPGIITLRSGVLPPGLGPISSAGVIPAGTPTTPGVYEYTIRNRASTGLFVDLEDEIIISLPMFALVSGGSGTRNTVMSVTGMDWTATQVPAITSSRSIFAGPDRLVTWTDSAINYSVDLGVNWLTATETLTNAGLEGVFWEDYYVIVATTSGLVYSTNDSVNYTTVATPTAPVSYYIAGSDDLLMVVGGVALHHWWTATNPAGPWTEGAETGVGQGNHGELASDGAEFRLGNQQITNLGPPKIVRTTDGSSTEVMTLPTFASATRITCLTASRAGIWVAGTDSGEIIYDDGSGWTLSPDTMGGYCTDVKYNGALFVMSATLVSTSEYRYSINGLDWTLAPGTTLPVEAMAVQGELT